MAEPIPEWADRIEEDADGDGVRWTDDGFLLAAGSDRWPILDYRWANHRDEQVRRVASNGLRVRERHG